MKRSRSKTIAFLTTVCMVLSCIPWTLANVSANQDPVLRDPVDTMDPAQVYYLYAEGRRDQEGWIEDFDYGNGMIVVDPDDPDIEIPEEYAPCGLFVYGGYYQLNTDYFLPDSDRNITDPDFLLLADSAVIETDADYMQFMMSPEGDHVFISGGSELRCDGVVKTEVSDIGIDPDFMNMEDPYGYLLGFYDSFRWDFVYNYEILENAWLSGEIWGDTLTVDAYAGYEVDAGTSIGFNEIILKESSNFVMDANSLTRIHGGLTVEDNVQLYADENASLFLQNGAFVNGYDLGESAYLDETDEGVAANSDVYFRMTADGWTDQVFALNYERGWHESLLDDAVVSLSVNGGDLYDPEPGEPEFFNPEDTLFFVAFPQVEYKGLPLEPKAYVNILGEEPLGIPVERIMEEDNVYYTFEYTPEDTRQFTINLEWSEYDSFWYDPETEYEFEAERWGNGTISIPDIDNLPEGVEAVESPDGNRFKIRVSRDVVDAEISFNMKAEDNSWLSILRFEGTMDRKYRIFNPWDDYSYEPGAEDRDELEDYFFDEDDGSYTLVLPLDELYDGMRIIADYWGVSSGIGIDDTRGYNVKVKLEDEWVDINDIEGIERDWRIEIPQWLFDGLDNAELKFVFEPDPEAPGYDPEAPAPVIKGVYYEYFTEGHLERELLPPNEDNEYTIPTDNLPCNVWIPDENEQIIFDGQFGVGWHWMDSNSDVISVEGYGELISEDEYGNSVYSFAPGTEIRITLKDYMDQAVADVMTPDGHPLDELYAVEDGDNIVLTYTPETDEAFKIEIYADYDARYFDNYNPEGDDKMIKFGIRDYDEQNPGGRIEFDTEKYEFAEYRESKRVLVPGDEDQVEFTIFADNDFEIFDRNGNRISKEDNENLIYNEQDNCWTFILPFEGDDNWNYFEVRFIGEPGVVNNTDRDIEYEFVGVDDASGTLHPGDRISYPEGATDVQLFVDNSEDSNICGLRLRYDNFNYDDLFRFDDVSGPAMLETTILDGVTIYVNGVEYQKAYDGEFMFLYTGDAVDVSKLSVKDANDDTVLLEDIYYLPFDKDEICDHKFYIVTELPDPVVTIERNNADMEFLDPDEQGIYTIPDEYFYEIDPQDPNSMYDGFTVRIYDDMSYWAWDNLWPEWNEKSVEMELSFTDTIPEEARAAADVRIMADGDTEMSNHIRKADAIREIFSDKYDLITVCIYSGGSDFRVRYWDPAVEHDVTVDPDDIYWDEDLEAWCFDLFVGRDEDGRYNDRVWIDFYQTGIRNNGDDNRYLMEYSYGDSEEWTEFVHDDFVAFDKTYDSTSVRVTSRSEDPFEDQVNCLRLWIDGENGEPGHEIIVPLDADGVYTFDHVEWDYPQIGINPSWADVFDGQFRFERRGDGDITLSENVIFDNVYSMYSDDFKDGIKFSVTGPDDGFFGIAIMPNSGWTFVLSMTPGDFEITPEFIEENNLRAGFKIIIYTDIDDFNWDTIHATADGAEEVEVPVEVWPDPQVRMSEGGEIVVEDGQNVTAVSNSNCNRCRFIYPITADPDPVIRFRIDMNAGWELEVVRTNGDDPEDHLEPDGDGYYEISVQDMRDGRIWIEFIDTNEYIYIEDEPSKEIIYWYGDDEDHPFATEDGRIILPADVDTVTIKVNDNTGDDAIRGFEIKPIVPGASIYTELLTEDKLVVTREAGDSWEMYRIYPIYEGEVADGEIKFEDHTGWEGDDNLGNRLAFYDGYGEFQLDTIYTRATAAFDTFAFDIDDGGLHQCAVYKVYDDHHVESVPYTYPVEQGDPSGYIISFEDGAGFVVKIYASEEEAVYDNMNPGDGDAILDYLLGYDEVDGDLLLHGAVNVQNVGQEAALDDGRARAAVHLEGGNSATIRIKADEEYYAVVTDGTNDITDSLDTFYDEETGITWLVITVTFDEAMNQDIMPKIEFLPRIDINTIDGYADTDYIIYSGDQKTPEVVFSDGDYTLILDKDITVEYGENINAADNGGTITVTGIGKYIGEATIEFNIYPLALLDENVEISPESAVYTGSQITPDVTVTVGDKVLEEGEDKDYVVLYDENIDAGEDAGTVTVRGTGNYGGEVIVKFDIAPVEITEEFISGVPESAAYTGSQITPDVTVKDGETALTEGTDYTVTYGTNKDVGQGTVTVKGKGGYAGTVDLTFDIVAKTIKSSDVTGVPSSMTYTGSQLKPAVTVKVDGKTLKSGTDYTVTYGTNKDAGQGTVTIKGKGNYAGTVTSKFTIDQKDLSGGTISGAPSEVTYTGSAITPAVTFKLDGKDLKAGTDYKVTYSNNKEVGTAKITVEGIGNYKGSTSVNFTIKAKSEPSPSPSGKPSPSPSGKPTDNPTPTPPVDETGVGGFIDRLYDKVLGRAADQGGKDYWKNQVMKEGKTGADIAKGFLYSPEFLNKEMSDGDFLEILYNVFFDRASDAGGKDYWLGKMAGGMSKQDVIMGFINSTEWANVCLKYGIPSGGNGVPNKSVEPNEQVIAFARRLYETCLGRKADEAGLMDWAKKLANMQITGTKAAEGFFFSSEFIGHNFDNDEYITRLYRTFMGREPDQGGFDYWMSRFDQGASRMDVFNGFAQSKEFGEICASYGILR